MSGKRKHDVNGIYLIVNLINGKVYVGESARIYGRWWEHRSNLKKGKHSNQHLQSSWNLYGKELFKFYIIEETPNFNKQQRVEREVYYTKIHNSENPFWGFNIPNLEGIIFNSSRILKPRVYRKVYQICPVNNTVIKIWDKGKDVRDYLGVSEKSMEKGFWNVNGYKRVITYNGFIWIREKDYKEGFDYRLEANKPPFKERKKKEKPPKIYKPKEEHIRVNRKPVTLQNIETDEVRQFKSQLEIKKQLGFNPIHLIKGFKIKGEEMAVIKQWRGWKLSKLSVSSIC